MIEGSRSITVEGLKVEVSMLIMKGIIMEGSRSVILEGYMQ